MITLKGVIERITFYNEANHYTIAKLRPEKMTQILTLVGYLAGIRPGETLKVEGHWDTHPKYGEQFKVETFEVVLPVTVKGIQAYLQSGIIEGIGPKTAALLVGKFKSDTFEIIETQPERLLEVEGIGAAKADLIRNAWQEHHALRGVLKFLQNHGINATYCAQILKLYGTSAVEMLKENPYLLVPEMPQNGFRIADTLALQLGMPQDAPHRVAAGLLYVLSLANREGHVYMTQNALIHEVVGILGLAPETVLEAIDQLTAAEEIVRVGMPCHQDQEPPSDGEEAVISLRTLYQAELGIAQKIMAMQSIPLMAPAIDADDIIETVMRRLAIQLSDEQAEVLNEVLNHRMLILTGGPGTGKTTLIRSITVVFEALGTVSVLAAPTGRAARRLGEVTGKKAETIHKLLKYNVVTGGFDMTPDNPLPVDGVIIDEASMVDSQIMYHLLRALPMTARLILVGDVFQLPSVGPGNVLSDLIQSGVIRTFELKKIFRQAQESPIVLNAHKVRNGEAPDCQHQNELTGGSEFYFIEQQDSETIVKTIAELCRHKIKAAFPHISEIQVLTPMHKGKIGTINLNQVLQKTLNAKAMKAIPVMGNFKYGDKVMHLKNNYQKEVFNGEIGWVEGGDQAHASLCVNYDGRRVNYEATELSELGLAYAITVHKSQGSEYTAVIMPLMTEHYPLLQRNLLYTAITRGKNLVVLIGSRKALRIALHNDKQHHRRTYLTQFLSL